MEEKEFDRRFTYHPPTEAQVPLYEMIRTSGRVFALVIGSNCPESREKALAFTALEEAIFWANAAIARRTEIGTMNSATGE